MATVIRPPVVTRIERPDPYRANLAAPVVGSSIALLLVTAAITTAPFLPVDQPNPRGASPAVSLLTWTQNPLTLRQPAQAPFFLTEQPNPRGAVPAIGLRTLALSGGAAFMPAATAPFSNPNWANPRRAPFPTSLLTIAQAAQQTSVQPPVTHHFQQWNVDRGAAIRAQAAQNLLQGPLASRPFFAADVATNPRAPVFPVALRTWLQQPQIAATATQPPVTHHFQQWSLDRGPSLRAQSSLSWAPLPYFSQKPAIPVDQPNPRGRLFPNELRTWTLNLLQGTLKPAEQAPFVQADWPVPKGAAFASDLRDWSKPTPLVAVAPVNAPHHQCDWPNPRGYEPNHNRSWSQTPHPSLIPAPYTRTTGCVLYFPLRLWAITSSVGVVPSADTTNLKSLLPHSSVQVLLQDGTMNPVWYRALRYMADVKLGGPSAPTLPDVVATVSDTQAAVSENTAAVSGVVQLATNNAEALQTVVEVAQDNGLSGADQIPPVQRSNQVES